MSDTTAEMLGMAERIAADCLRNYDAQSNGAFEEFLESMPETLRVKVTEHLADDLRKFALLGLEMAYLQIRLFATSFTHMDDEIGEKLAIQMTELSEFACLAHQGVKSQMESVKEILETAK